MIEEDAELQSLGGFVGGMGFITAINILAIYLSNTSILATMHFGPVIIAIIIGMAHSQFTSRYIPEKWNDGITFCAEAVLSTAIILYGLRISAQDINGVGTSGILLAVTMIVTTFVVGYLFGTKFLKLDRDTTILTCVGSSICGAAAIIATQKTIRCHDSNKSIMAITTTILFGTAAMFLYPLAFAIGVMPLDTEMMGYYSGATIHAVGQVIVAANSISPETEAIAIIIKMIRIIMLVPFLIIIGLWVNKTRKDKNAPDFLSGDNRRGYDWSEDKKLSIPWFAILFIIVAILNSMHLFPGIMVEKVLILDDFFMTMAMAALGAKSDFSKIREIGYNQIYLAAFLFFWLIGFGILAVKIII